MNLLFKMKIICSGLALKRNMGSPVISNNLLICVFYTDLISLFFKLGFQMEIIKCFVRFANTARKL